MDPLPWQTFLLSCRLALYRGKYARRQCCPPRQQRNRLKDRTPTPPGASTVLKRRSVKLQLLMVLAQLNLEFREDCWVDIKDADGKRLAYGVMKANTVQTLPVRRRSPWRWAIRGLVRLSLNGAPVDNKCIYPHRGSVSVRFEKLV